MTIARVIVDSNNLDDVKLIIRGARPALVFIKERESALELFHVLMVAWFQDHRGPLNTTIDGNDYTFSQSAWKALYHETDQWFGEYLADQSLEFPENEPESAEIIPLFGNQGDR
jgi:hypothetical protein